MSLNNYSSAFLVLLLSLNCVSATSEILHVETDAALFVVSDSFLSTALDFTLLAPGVSWANFNFSSPRLKTLLSGLSPSLLRVGGSPADYLFFDVPFKPMNVSDLVPNPYVIGKTDIDKLVKLTRETGTRLLYDLNLQLRFGEQWDPSEAIKLFDYCQMMGYGENIDFELGNEPDAYNKPQQGKFSGSQIGQDFIRLRKVLGLYPNFRGSRLVGPDVIGIGSLLEGFAKTAAGCVDAFTFHHYYFEGDIATWKDYIMPARFENLQHTINAVKTILNWTSASRPLWIGETSDSWHGGTPNVSDRYISGFLWLDKLGLSAQNGVELVIRQTLYGFQQANNYALLNDQLFPNPDYWLSYVYKRLVGNEVFNTSLTPVNENVRVYAHCTKLSPMYPRGGMTVFVLNIDVENTVVVQAVQFSTQQVDVYLLTPGDHTLLSTSIALNGEILRMCDDMILPELKPMKKISKDGITLPPLTFGFFVFPNLRLKACTQ